MACLSDLDAYCIKSNRTKSLSECQNQIDTVLKDMAFRRLTSDLPKLSICMTILTHLRYRVIQITNDVSANATKFSKDYQIFYSTYLSPKSQASSSKKRRISNDITTSWTPVTNSRSSSFSQRTEIMDMCVANCSHYEQSVNSVPIEEGEPDANSNVDVERTISIENAYEIDITETERAESASAERTMRIENASEFHCSSADLIIDHNNDVTSSRHYPDYSDYFTQCPCVSLNIPSVFHCDCIDLTTLLQPFEPFHIRDEFGDRIEILDPQKLIGSKRSQERFSLDELYSIGSTRNPAMSSNSTLNLVDWRELLSWASSGGRFYRLLDAD